MSNFKYHRNNNHRYNIYESHNEVVAQKSFYLLLRNSLFLIALILTLLVTNLISFDTYKTIKDKTSRTLLITQVQENQMKDVISNSIIKKIDIDNSFENFNHQQLKRIVKNVMEKVESSPNQVIYTQK